MTATALASVNRQTESLTRRLEAARATVERLDAELLAASFGPELDRRAAQRLAADRAAALLDLAAAEQAASAAVAYRAKAMAASAEATFRTATARRTEIRARAAALLGTERDLLRKLEAAQRDLEELVDADWAAAAEQAAAVTTARLEGEIAARLSGLGLILDYGRLAAGLAADEATVKGR